MKKIGPPPAPPRWVNFSAYDSDLRSVWEVEVEYNRLLVKRGIITKFRRLLLNMKYGSIYKWNAQERVEIERYLLRLRN